MSADPPLRVTVAGARGQMGGTVCRAVLGAGDLRLAAAVDPSYEGPSDDALEVPAFTDLESALAGVPSDVVVDFTRPESVRDNILASLRSRVPVVVGTTGLGLDDLEKVRAAADAAATPVFVAPNFALGAVLMMEFSRQAAKYLTSCEVVELHHDRKLDAPSGTAKRTAELIEEVWQNAGAARRVPIHSVRLPGLVAHQEVIFGGVGQTLTIRHDSLSRESFMAGVLLAVRRVGQLQGVVVGLENLL